MNINNIDKARKFLDFNNRFYTLELIGRYKDKNYDNLDVITIPIFEINEYDQISNLLASYCDKLNTRLYLSLNGISYENSLQKTKSLLNHPYATDLDKCRMLGNYYKYDTKNYKYILIDIDDMSECEPILEKLKYYNIEPLDIFDSKTGKHIIINRDDASKVNLFKYYHNSCRILLYYNDLKK